VSKHSIKIKSFGALDELNVKVEIIRNFEIDKNTQKYY
tara:strand:- start:278 stop:391 length:114 start_codon:yes stop_codon:yes gene_type:complete